jgi:hypothetical protein
MTSTFENVSDIGVCLGLCLAPPANAGVRSKQGAVHITEIERSGFEVVRAPQVRGCRDRGADRCSDRLHGGRLGQEGPRGQVGGVDRPDASPRSRSSAVPLRPSPRWPGHRCSQPYSAGPPPLSCRVEFGTDQPALFEFGTGFLLPETDASNRPWRRYLRTETGNP